MTNSTTFVENADGVHVEISEHTLCGDSFDIGSTEGEACGNTMPTTKRVVTCKRCAAIVMMCRGVRIGVVQDRAEDFDR